LSNIFILFILYEGREKNRYRVLFECTDSKIQQRTFRRRDIKYISKI